MRIKRLIGRTKYAKEAKEAGFKGIDAEIFIEVRVNGSYQDALDAIQEFHTEVSE